jgi:hypothetical protein
LEPPSALVARALLGQLASDYRSDEMRISIVFISSASRAGLLPLALSGSPNTRDVPMVFLHVLRGTIQRYPPCRRYIKVICDFRTWTWLALSHSARGDGTLSRSKFYIGRLDTRAPLCIHVGSSRARVRKFARFNSSSAPPPPRAREYPAFLPPPAPCGLRRACEGVITFRRGRFQTPSRRDFRTSVRFLRDRQAERGNARNESNELIRPRYSRRVATCEIARLPFYRRC